jgi:glycine hydroxymethyltransferase
MFAGGTAIPRTIDFAAYAEIAREVGAIFVADIAHIAGLVAAGVHPSPVPHADVVSSTTHKTLRGPRGGLLMCKEGHAKAIDRAVFPGLQGGPHNHTTAGLAVALREASTPEFKAYAAQIIANAQALAAGLVERGFAVITGGTDNHLVLVDVTSKGVAGKPLAKALDVAGLVCNYNTVPFDPRKPFDPSGIRLGTLGGHQPRHGHGRDGADRRLDRSGRAGADRRRGAGAGPRRGRRGHAALPRPGPGARRLT